MLHYAYTIADCAIWKQKENTLDPITCLQTKVINLLFEPTRNTKLVPHSVAIVSKVEPPTSAVLVLQGTVGNRDANTSNGMTYFDHTDRGQWETGMQTPVMG